MKRIAIISVLFLVLTGSFSHAEENYKNGNGTLIYRDSSDEKNIEVRKFGWVFGGYVCVERGGPLFETPEDEIRYLVGYMP